ncbi:3-dehydroquinate synthase [Candidatus Izimaplasma bacterium ZiA1]|uniref:3-dehydroquinate synthase n=1 Tax=Candidatus Izimoplasma sp. ZiA1 TaxID=2024899 RepID=UPI000BAA6457|nr:3-dehydroquinate synthase [Candidatus Izimaplasma bacterium ZiA1]
MNIINVSYRNTDYNIYIDNNILDNLKNYVDTNKKILIITDDKLPKKYIKNIGKQLIDADLFVFESGEINKSEKTLFAILNHLAKNNYSRDSLLIALGGGITGDITAMAASIYKRGIDYINIPTTLLSQVDSSVGGKTAINSEHGKNLFGTFYNPIMVLIDPTTLNTLTERQKSNGIAEIIKYGLIHNEEIINCLENENLNYEKLIKLSIKSKLYFVAEDPYDKKNRQILNFGHTIGHALEKASNYEYLHGEAIAYGIKKMIKGTDFENRVLNLLKKYNLDINIKIDIDKLYNYIKNDKKISNNKMSLILVKKIGNGFIKTIELKDIRKFL